MNLMGTIKGMTCIKINSIWLHVSLKFKLRMPKMDVRLYINISKCLIVINVITGECLNMKVLQFDFYVLQKRFMFAPYKGKWQICNHCILDAFHMKDKDNYELKNDFKYYAWFLSCFRDSSTCSEILVEWFSNKMKC